MRGLQRPEVSKVDFDVAESCANPLVHSYYPFLGIFAYALQGAAQYCLQHV